MSDDTKARRSARFAALAKRIKEHAAGNTSQQAVDEAQREYDFAVIEDWGSDPQEYDE